MQLTWSQQNKKHKIKQKKNKQTVFIIHRTVKTQAKGNTSVIPNKLFHLDNLTHNSPTCV